MSEIAANVARLRGRIAAACADVGRDPADVALLAVSKYTTSENIRIAHAAGQRVFGESRVQDLAKKALELQSQPDVFWHLIGSLQTNKVRDLVRVKSLALLHTLDRIKLADELQRELEREARCFDVLVQVNATGEEQKHGCVPEDASRLLDHVLTRCPLLRIRGLMAMGPTDGDARPVFDRIAVLRDSLRIQSGLEMTTLSLGMSGDLEDAIGAGSTLLRIGSAVFGSGR
jgi:PLP dependent protein